MIHLYIIRGYLLTYVSTYLLCSHVMLRQATYSRLRMPRLEVHYDRVLLATEYAQYSVHYSIQTYYYLAGRHSRGFPNSWPRNSERRTAVYVLTYVYIRSSTHLSVSSRAHSGALFLLLPSHDVVLLAKGHACGLFGHYFCTQLRPATHTGTDVLRTLGYTVAA